MTIQPAEKPIIFEQNASEPVRWLRLVPRWSLMVALVTAAIPIVLFGAVGQQASDNALGTEYVELLQALRNPGMFRLGWSLDAVVWLLIGGSLLALAGILRRHAPIRAILIAACGMAQLMGTLGGFIRLNGTSDIAALYATASPERQAVLLDSYLNLWRVINSHYHVAVFLLGPGFLLAAWSLFSLRGFPRWLAAWVVLPGMLALAQFVLVAAGSPFSRPLNILDAVVGNFALNLALAVALWRPSTTLVTSVAGGSDGR